MALKAGRVGVAPSQVKPDGTLNVTIPDPPAPTPATKLYSKQYTLDKSKMSTFTLVADVLYMYRTTPNLFPITIEGYTPVAVKIIDTYTGYWMMGACIADNFDNGSFSINFLSQYHGASNDFAKAIVYYMKNSDISPLT